MNKRLLVLAVAALASGQLAAEEAKTEKEWEASAELGFVSTSGNTETETLNGKVQATREGKIWRHEGDITVLKSSDATTTTAEKYTVFAQSNYKISDVSFLFGNIGYENDKFSGYDYRVTETIGYGHRVLHNESMTLDLEIGPGARQSKLDNGDTESEGIVRGAAKYKWKISPTSKFSEVLTVEAGEDVTVTKSVTSLSSKINSALSMKLTFTYKNTSDVPVGVEETDTETAVTLVYSF